MCDLSDMDRCDLWSETRRKAAKEHRCSSCGGSITKGAEYVVHFSKYDGYVSSEKMCAACDVDREKFTKEHGGGPVPSAFREFLVECIDDGPKSAAEWTPVLLALDARAASAPKKARARAEGKERKR